MNTVQLKIEGIREKDPISFELPGEVTISEFLKQASEDERAEKKQITDYLYNQQTGEIGIYMVIVNETLVNREQFDSYKVSDGDKVTLLMPVGGG